MTTALDDRTALIVVDLQKGILGFTPEDVASRVVGAASELVAAFRDAELPIVWVHATGLPRGRVERGFAEPEELPADFSELAESLDAREGDLHVYKNRTISAFSKSTLAEDLRTQGVTQVVIVGIATGAGVESAARSAYDEGFNVTVVSDAVFHGDPERHEHSLTRTIPTIGVVTTAKDVLEAFAQR